ncbi:hypothetical protein L3i20_v208970 [Paenibacillus sp. L3-i20]|nr:hypothetical protein L3i20_v208970 [Paenibacillus sp. L3-i20]
MVRNSEWTGKEAVERYNLNPEAVFSFTTGPVFLYCSGGLVVAVGSNPSINSVTIRPVGRIEHEEEREGIDSLDNTYSDFEWTKVMHKKIQRVSIMKGVIHNVKYESLPNEVGICFTMDNGVQFILSHGLHDHSDDFSVIFMEQVMPDLVESVEEI